MATTDKIIADYIEFIGKEVVDTFGGSYQNYQTLGKEWRQKIGYTPTIENFIINKTNLFLRLQSVRDKNNFNMMYNLCYDISDHLSNYIVKKSPDLTKKAATNIVWNKIFFNSKAFQARFKKKYKRPIDLSNKEYCKTNPGVVSMYLMIRRTK